MSLRDRREPDCSDHCLLVNTHVQPGGQRPPPWPPQAISRGNILSLCPWSRLHKYFHCVVPKKAAALEIFCFMTLLKQIRSRNRQAVFHLGQICLELSLLRTPPPSLFPSKGKAQEMPAFNIAFFRRAWAVFVLLLSLRAGEQDFGFERCLSPPCLSVYNIQENRSG